MTKMILYFIALILLVFCTEQKIPKHMPDSDESNKISLSSITDSTFMVRWIDALKSCLLDQLTLQQDSTIKLDTMTKTIVNNAIASLEENDGGFRKDFFKLIRKNLNMNKKHDNVYIIEFHTSGVSAKTKFIVCLDNNAYIFINKGHFMVFQDSCQMNNTAIFFDKLHPDLNKCKDRFFFKYFSITKVSKDSLECKYFVCSKDPEEDMILNLLGYGDSAKINCK